MYRNFLTDHTSKIKYPLTATRHQPGSHGAVQFHDHDFTEVAMITAGTGIHHFRNSFSKISTGDLLVIPEGIHHYYSDASTLGVVNLLFRPDAFLSKEMFNTLNECFNGAFVPETASPSPYVKLNAENIEHYMDSISALEVEFYRQNAAGGFGINHRLHEILMFLINVIDTSNEPTVRDHFSTVISFINNNYNQNISIDLLCSMTNMSRRNFFRSFKHYIGCSPVEYLTRIRVKASCDLLKNSTFSMSEIAFTCGFCDSNFFSKQFRLHCNMSPSDYRKKHKKMIEEHRLYIQSLHSVVAPDLRSDGGKEEMSGEKENSAEA
jgi:AraC-like DNA-binding protein